MIEILGVGICLVFIGWNSVPWFPLSSVALRSVCGGCGSLVSSASESLLCGHWGSQAEHVSRYWGILVSVLGSYRSECYENHRNNPRMIPLRYEQLSPSGSHGLGKVESC